MHCIVMPARGLVQQGPCAGRGPKTGPAKLGAGAQAASHGPSGQQSVPPAVVALRVCSGARCCALERTFFAAATLSSSLLIILVSSFSCRGATHLREAEKHVAQCRKEDNHIGCEAHIVRT